MRTVSHLAPDDARRLPWKNGRGVTEELALWPAHATFERGDFEWRISKARVEEAGPFSAFPGFDRILVVTHGEGLVLAHPDGRARVKLRKLEPYTFSGDDMTSAELVRGGVADFNVLTRRDVARANVEVLPLGTRRARESLAPGHAFAHVLAGACTVRVSGEEEPLSVASGESVWVSECGAGDELDFTGHARECVVLLVHIGRVEHDAH